MHDPQSYTRYRPRYPAALFSRLCTELPADATVVDLGAGTGLSLRSLADAGIQARFIAIEPDPGMVAEGRASFPSAEWITAPAEQTGLPTGLADTILIASAYHWMPRPAVDDEILRLRKTGGSVWIFEYQFPKTPEHTGLNEWIRRRFNTIWKFPEQKPRGRLEELTAGLRPHFQKHQTLPLDHFQAELSCAELGGLIFSQARALSYLNQLSAPERAAHVGSTTQTLAAFYGAHERLPFRFRLAGLIFS